MTTPPPPPGPPAYNPNPYGASPAGQPQASGKTRLRGRTPRRLALIFGVVGLALVIVGAVVLATKSFDKVDKFERVKLQSLSTVNFDRTGRYVAYYEAGDVDNGTREVPIVPIALQSPSEQCAN